MTIPPVYSALTHRMAILQQLQRLSDQPRTVTLADMVSELIVMQQEFGAARSLEEIIQADAGVQLAAQRLGRQQRKVVQG
jgi:hypothetical protein